MIRVRLTRKLAERLNDIDLSGRTVGDVLELSDRHAMILLAEGWAEIVDGGAASAPPHPGAPIG